MYVPSAFTVVHPIRDFVDTTNAISSFVIAFLRMIITRRRVYAGGHLLPVGLRHDHRQQRRDRHPTDTRRRVGRLRRATGQHSETTCDKLRYNCADRSQRSRATDDLRRVKNSLRQNIGEGLQHAGNNLRLRHVRNDYLQHWVRSTSANSKG